MKVFVYGTLKRGYGNNALLAKAKFIEKRVLPGFKLYNAGFPVARESPGDSIVGEVFEISKDDKNTLQWLDRLESNGRMYNRTEAGDVQLYVGHPDYWDFRQLAICPKDEDHNYFWERSF